MKKFQRKAHAHVAAEVRSNSMPAAAAEVTDSGKTTKSKKKTPE